MRQRPAGTVPTWPDATKAVDGTPPPFLMFRRVDLDAGLAAFRMDRGGTVVQRLTPWSLSAEVAPIRRQVSVTPEFDYRPTWGPR